MELQVGDMLSSGFLVFNQAAQLYEGTFQYPRGTVAGAKVSVKSLILEDYYGNQSVLNPQ
jgi:hypothetical protein